MQRHGGRRTLHSQERDGGAGTNKKAGLERAACRRGQWGMGETRCGSISRKRGVRNRTVKKRTRETTGERHGEKAEEGAEGEETGEACGGEREEEAHLQMDIGKSVETE